MSASFERQQSRLVLVRHGQAMLGTDDYDRLSQRGHTQSRLLGERLRAELGPAWPAWSGSLRRHRETLAAIVPAGEQLVDPALDEYFVAALIRSAIEQAEMLALTPPSEQALADPVTYLQSFLDWFPHVLDRWQLGRLKDEENGTWASFQHRVLSPIPAWQQRLAGRQHVVVVTSAGVISTLVARLLGYDLAWQRHFNVSLYNSSVTELVLDPGGDWHEVRLNCIEHLAEPELRTLA